MTKSWAMGAALGVLLTASAGAQTSADIKGEVWLPGGPIVPPGAIARVHLTATNLGPDTTIGSVGVGAAFTPNVGSRNFELLQLDETPPCTVRATVFVAPPGQLSTVVVSIFMERMLAPSESATCIVGLRTFPESPAVQRVRFGFAPLTEDPDPSNNRVSVEIRTGSPPPSTQPIEIPAASSQALLFLLVTVCAAGSVVLRRTV
ncbi:hypothetical protein [Aquimonas voraii]|nr:hypothetical protein [Aquimonas voraii]